MNDMHDERAELSVERRDRAGHDSDRDKPREDRAADATPPDKAPSATIGDDAFPERIRRKYYVVADEAGKDAIGQEARLYADERGEYCAFKVKEDRLVTRLEAAEVIRDMIAVAQHRHWQALHVRGSEDFRREAWLEANARGMEVQGYEPTELDGQALAARREAWDRARPRTPEVDNHCRSVNGDNSARLDYDTGVSGRLIEVGQHPLSQSGGCRAFDLPHRRVGRWPAASALGRRVGKGRRRQQRESWRSYSCAPGRRRARAERHQGDRRGQWQGAHRAAAGFAQPMAGDGGEIPLG